MAGRILGMGDVVSLVEKAAEAISEDDARRMEQKLRSASFDLDDFLQQFKALRKMGPLENILGMVPGMDKLKGSSVDEKQLKRVEAIILSMTPLERARPDILNARRRQRIARGSGTHVSEVNNLILRFTQMRKMMKNMGSMKKLMAKAGGGLKF
jgi:signal recognition particle subunit SRP54